MRMILSFLVATAQLIGSVQAASASERSRAFAMERLANLQTETENLGAAINKWQRSANDGQSYSSLLSQIDKPARSVVSEINNTTRDLKNYNTTYSLTQSFRVATSVQDLAYAVNNSVAALNRKMPDITALLAQSIAAEDLKSLLNASDNLANVLLNNVPKKLLPIALNLKSQVIDSLAQGLSCANGIQSNCSGAEVSTNRTHLLALHYGAIRNDGTPIA